MILIRLLIELFLALINNENDYKYREKQKLLQNRSLCKCWGIFPFFLIFFPVLYFFLKSIDSKIYWTLQIKKIMTNLHIGTISGQGVVI
uniref:Uncharacterized protein n=1 Tax=Panagrolaimus sp. JU765 TaxID=591449 RepID=A0AC34R9H3_9BILA